MTERINAAELSRRLEVTRGAVSKAVKSGRITPGEDGFFDAEEAARQWTANTRPAMKATASPAAKSKATGYAEARARKERATASIAEMQEAQMRKTMMETHLCGELAANLNWAWSGFVDSLPVHLARAVQGKQSFADTEAAIEAAIRDRMADLPALVKKAVMQAGMVELPPSPLEKAILERMQAGSNARAGEAVRKLWVEISGVFDPESLRLALEVMAKRLAPAVAPLATVEEVHACIIGEVEALYLAYSERLLEGLGKLEGFKVQTR